MVHSFLETWLNRRMGRIPGTPVTQEELRGWQLKRLRALVRHTQEKSPFHGELYAGLQPESIQSFDDYAQVPFTTPEDVRAASSRMVCVSQDEIARIVTLQSSGTTGEPKRIHYTAADLAATRDYFRWGMAHLVAPGETALVLMPGDRPDGVGRLLANALADGGARAVAHGVMEDSDAAVDHCLREEAVSLVGSPAHLNMFAGAWERRGLDKGRIKSVLLCWDTIPQAVVNRVHQALGCKVYRHWGMIETGLGGAVECSPGSGMHLRETDLYVEIVDPKTLDPVEDGTFGEIVVTTPLKLGMPLIRYRTGDRGRILPGQCPHCDSVLRRLDSDITRLPSEENSSPLGDLLPVLNEFLYGIEGVEDFSVTLDGDSCHLNICSFNGQIAKKFIQPLKKELFSGYVKMLNFSTWRYRLLRRPPRLYPAWGNAASTAKRKQHESLCPFHL